MAKQASVYGFRDALHRILLLSRTKIRMLAPIESGEKAVCSEVAALSSCCSVSCLAID